MSQEILEKVCSIVSEQLSVESGEVKSDSNFQNDLGADSLDTVELVMALEEAFDIERHKAAKLCKVLQILAQSSLSLIFLSVGNKKESLGNSLV